MPDRQAGSVFAMSPTGVVEMALLIRGIFSASLLECESGGSRSLALFPVGPHGAAGRNGWPCSGRLDQHPSGNLKI